MGGNTVFIKEENDHHVKRNRLGDDCDLLS